MNTFKWNHRTTMANHSCPGYSDVWRFCNNDFIFVMSTCRFLIRPGRWQGAGSLAIPVSGLRRTAPQQPVAKQQGHAITPCANPPRVLASKTTADRHKQQIYSFAKTDLFKESRNWTQTHELSERELRSLYNHTSLSSSLWPGDAIWRHRTGSIFTHLMAICLTAQAIT